MHSFQCHWLVESEALAREGRLARSGRPLVSMQVRRMLADLDAHGAA